MISDERCLLSSLVNIPLAIVSHYRWRCTWPQYRADQFKVSRQQVLNMPLGAADLAAISGPSEFLQPLARRKQVSGAASDLLVEVQHVEDRHCTCKDAGSDIQPQAASCTASGPRYASCEAAAFFAVAMWNGGHLEWLWCIKSCFGAGPKAIKPQELTAHHPTVLRLWSLVLSRACSKQLPLLKCHLNSDSLHLATGGTMSGQL